MGRWRLVAFNRILVFVVIIVLDHELGLFLTRRVLGVIIVFDFFPLPKDFCFESGSFAVDFKDNRQDTLENTNTVENFLCGITFRASSFDEGSERRDGCIIWRRKGVIGDKVEQPGGDDSDEGCDILRSFKQGPADLWWEGVRNKVCCNSRTYYRWVL